MIDLFGLDQNHKELILMQQIAFDPKFESKFREAIKKQVKIHVIVQ